MYDEPGKTRWPLPNMKMPIIPSEPPLNDGKEWNTDKQYFSNLERIRGNFDVIFLIYEPIWKYIFYFIQYLNRNEQKHAAL